jgi:hypothetical protein
MAKYTVEERLSWRGWVTPKPLEDKPIHRWYVFPHSFSRELVHELIEEWDLGSKDHILDPFAGAGTTILAAKERGVPASGYDLSPLAALAARTKIANFNISRIEHAWKSLEKTLDPSLWNGVSRLYPELVQKALPGRLLGGFDAVARHIDHLSGSNTERDFFRLASLTTVPVFSRAVVTGGWLKWVERRNKVTSLPSVLSEHVEMMLDDLQVEIASSFLVAS